MRGVTRGSCGGGELDEFGKNAAEIGWVQEGDGCAHGPVPGPLVYQPDAGFAERGECLADVVDAVPDVVNPLAAPGQELAHRRVGSQRLEQLDVAGYQGTLAHGQHGLADPLGLVALYGYNLEAKRRLVKLNGLVQVAAGDADMIDTSQQR